MPQVKEREKRRQRASTSGTIRYGLADSPLGRLLLAATDKGICALRFGDDDAVLEDEVRGEHSLREFARDDAALRPWIETVVRYLEGGRPELDLPLDVPGTDFQRRVWRKLQAIPYGRTKSYGDIARAIGRPKAMRAVGQACGRNPVPIIVPCHRVLRGHGQLGGFSMGLERKKFLLALEGSVTTSGRRNVQRISDSRHQETDPE